MWGDDAVERAVVVMRQPVDHRDYIGAGALLRMLVRDAALSGCGFASFDDLTWPPPSTSVSGMPLSLHCVTR